MQMGLLGLGPVMSSNMADFFRFFNFSSINLFLPENLKFYSEIHFSTA